MFSFQRTRTIGIDSYRSSLEEICPSKMRAVLSRGRRFLREVLTLYFPMMDDSQEHEVQVT